MKKVLSISAITVGSLAILCGVVPIILEMSAPSSVGIIGGADGPTTIMIAGTVGIWSFFTVIAIGVLLLIIGICGLRKRLR